MTASSGPQQSGSTQSYAWVWTVVKAGVTAGTLYYTVHSVRNARLRKKAGGKPLPALPGNHWLRGSIPVLSQLITPGEHIDTAIFRIMKKWPQLGKFFAMDFKLLNYGVVCDPDAVREILITKDLPKSPTYWTLNPFIGTKSMLTAQPAVWKKQRLAFTSGFAPAHIRTLIPMFAERCQVLLDRLQRVSDKGEVVLLHNELTLLTMDVIRQAVLSADLGYLTNDQPPEVYYSFDSLITEVQKFAEHPQYIVLRFLPWNWYKFHKAVSKLDNTLMPHIKSRLLAHDKKSAENEATQEQDKGQRKRKDILDMALAAARADGGRLDFEEVLSQVKTFLFAGHDTTASTLGFTVYELTRHPEVEAKLVQEIDSVLGDRLPTADDLNNLKYMNAVIKESMRMWPPGGTARWGHPGDTVQEYDVSKVVLYCSHIHIHRDPDIWGPNAGDFVPERWLDEAYIKSLHPMAYMPFSKGPRDCIGQNFAMMEGKTLLAMLYQRFTFKYKGAQPEEQGLRITTHPRYHVPVSVHPRKTKAKEPSKPEA